MHAYGELALRRQIEPSQSLTVPELNFPVLNPLSAARAPPDCWSRVPKQSHLGLIGAPHESRIYEILLSRGRCYTTKAAKSLHVPLFLHKRFKTM